MICSMSTTLIFLPSIGNSSMLTRRRSLLRLLPETLRSFKVLMPSGSFFTEDTYACYAWNKLCKRELFDTIRFPVGRVMEDLGIAHKILFDAGQIVYSDEPLYYYYQRDGSTLHTDCIKFFQDRLAMVTERYLFLEKLYPDMLENDAYFVDMALNDYPILYRSALDPESDQLIRHAYQKSRSILSFYNKMRFAFFSRSKALYYFIERRNCNLARYDNC